MHADINLNDRKSVTKVGIYFVNVGDSFFNTSTDIKGYFNFISFLLFLTM